MKLRNKKTGEIGKLHCDMNVSPAKYGVFEDTDIRGHYWEYNSLAELNEEWEDVPEPTEWYFIDAGGEIRETAYLTDDDKDSLVNFGNKFETREEAEKSLKKLKAITRLKNKGFEFELWDYDGGNYSERIRTGKILFRVKEDEDVDELLDLLFGDEE